MNTLIKTAGLIALVIAGTAQAASIDMRRDAETVVAAEQEFDFDALASNTHINAMRDYLKQSEANTEIAQLPEQAATFTYEGKKKHAFSIQNQAYVEHADDSWPLLSVNIQDGKLNLVKGSEYDANFAAGRFGK